MLTKYTNEKAFILLASKSWFSELFGIHMYVYFDTKKNHFKPYLKVLCMFKLKCFHDKMISNIIFKSVEYNVPDRLITPWSCNSS